MGRPASAPLKAQTFCHCACSATICCCVEAFALLWHGIVGCCVVTPMYCNRRTAMAVNSPPQPQADGAVQTPATATRPHIVKSAQAAVQLPQTWRDPEKALQFREDSQRKGDARKYHHFMSLPRLCTTRPRVSPMLEHAKHGLMYRHTHCLATLRILALQMSSESTRNVH